MVVGLGNPGHEYEWTRHNIGAHVVEELGKKHNLVFRAERGVEALMARGMIGEQPVVLACPQTFMNESGRSVNRLLRFVGATVHELLVVIDDIETPWKSVKTAVSGGTRGHNGLRSLQALLGSMEFAQLRFGVGRPGGGNVADYVLHRFSAEEMAELPALLTSAVVLIEEWVRG